MLRLWQSYTDFNEAYKTFRQNKTLDTAELRDQEHLNNLYRQASELLRNNPRVQGTSIQSFFGTYYTAVSYLRQRLCFSKPRSCFRARANGRTWSNHRDCWCPTKTPFWRSHEYCDCNGWIARTTVHIPRTSAKCNRCRFRDGRFAESQQCDGIGI